MRITLITHCWRYSRCLAYQLSSLILHRPQAEVAVVVFTTADDRPTNQMLDWFEARPEVGGSELTITRVYQPLEQLLQRSIGRNVAARNCYSDVAWFTDCDHVFGPGCIDAIPALEPDTFYWPRTVLRHVAHALGDAAAAAVTGPDLYDVEPADYEPVGQRGIGGLQIVAGETARRRGYCPDGRWQRPVPRDCHHFGFGSDVTFRRSFTRQVPLELPQLYRIRQTVSGEVDTLQRRKTSRGDRASSPGV